MKTEKKKSKQDEISSSDKRIRSKDLSDLKDLKKRGGGGRVWRLERERREKKVVECPGRSVLRGNARLQPDALIGADEGPLLRIHSYST